MSANNKSENRDMPKPIPRFLDVGFLDVGFVVSNLECSNQILSSSHYQFQQ